jgi:response regulator RpfG family c-di-GMP phosphodiesterase
MFVILQDSCIFNLKDQGMNSYAVMLQTDEDDKYITESTLSEIDTKVPVVFIAGVDELKEVIPVSGEPKVILINDSFRNTAREQLNQLKSDPGYSHIPVVILGEIVAEEYIRQYYRSGASTYITKPSTVAATKKKIDTFFRYWFDTAEG